VEDANLALAEMSPTEKDAPRFKGGKQKNRDGWGIIEKHPEAKKIKKWWHREKNLRGGHDMTKEEAEDIIAEWERRGYDYD
jgi:hypothetical protein